MGPTKRRWLTVVTGLVALLLAAPLRPAWTQAPVTLNVWASPDNADALADIGQRFTQANPTIKITVTPISWEVLYPRMLADIASRTGAFDVATWDVMTAGAMAPGFVDLAKFREDNPRLVDPAYDLKDFHPTIWHIGGVWAGKNIGIPFYNNTMLFYYRKDHFANPTLQAKFKTQYGRDLKPPTTWQETVDVAKFFTKKFNPDSPTDYGIALMFPRTHTLFYMYVLFFAPYRRSQDGLKKFGPVDLDYGDYFTAKKEPAFATPEGVKAVEDMKALLPYSPDPLGADYGETLESFARGTVAMVPQWTGVWAAFREAAALKPIEQKVGVALMPGGHSVSGIWGLGINVASKHKPEAFRFLQFATNKANDKAKFIKFGVAPARMSTLKDPEARRLDPRVPVLEATYPTQGYRPRIPQEPKLEDITVGVLSEMLGGKRPITVAELAKLADEWAKLLK
ncbi:MAG: sugar ABC transporter substrate-binding protein [Armatimonadota bacterium]|nr:sugar ABC transporter substrate-binding protein [Armatimonadota bacterium]MDR7558644.1 sugar ABC transporter substrate-binding protein [Armatimonadota bacterium]